MPVPAAQSIHSRGLLRDEVYRSIRDAIVRGELVPGEKLRDSELEAWLGVSRTPIREALLRLNRAGLVEARPGSVTRVAPEDLEHVRHGQQIAGELHSLAVRLCGERLDADALEDLREANARLSKAIERRDADAAIEADEDFHSIPVIRSQNPLIAEHLEVVTATLRRAEYMHFHMLTGIDSPAQHEAIVQALENGDVETASDLTRKNWLRLA